MAIQTYQATADAVGTASGTFNITGSNDQFSVSIDGGSNQVFTLTHGAARTAAQIVADLAALTGAVATVFGLLVRITTTSALGASSTILFNAPSNNSNTVLGFSGTYSGSPRVNTTFTGGTIQQIINGIETALLAAGWTTISGSGTGTLVMQSGLTPAPQNLQMRLRVKTNAGNCCTVTIENVAGSKVATNSTTAGLMLLPAAAKVFRVIANKYQAFIFTSSVNTAREFACWGVPALPTPLQGVITEAIWGACNSVSDTDTTNRDSFRVALSCDGSSDNVTGANVPNQAFILNGTLLEWANNGVTGGGNNAGNCSLRLATTTGARFPQATTSPNQTGGGVKWHDDESFIVDAILCFGITGQADEAKARGYLWDAAIVTDSFTADSTTSFSDGSATQNWFVVTNNNAGTKGVARGSLFLIVP